jgi:hypothetical protein
MALELLGVGITSRHHRGVLGDAPIGLPQRHAVLFGQAHQPFDRRTQELGRNVMFLGCTVVSTVTRLRSRLRSALAACATRRLSARRRSSLSPSRLRQWLRSERSWGNSVKIDRSWSNDGKVQPLAAPDIAIENFANIELMEPVIGPR